MGGSWYRPWRRFGGDPDVIAYFAALVAAGSPPDDIEKDAVKALIQGLKANGFFTRFKRLWLRSPSSSAGSLIDFISLNSSTLVNAPSWSTTGFTTNGTTNYIQTDANLNALGLTADDVSFGTYWRSSTPGTVRTYMGANANLSGRPNFIRTSGGNLEFTDGTLSAIASGAQGGGAGFFSGSARSNADRSIYKNGTEINNNTTASPGNFPGRAMFIGANNNNLVANFFIAGEECLSYLASPAFTTAEMATLYTLIQTYQTNVITGGRQV